MDNPLNISSMSGGYQSQTDQLVQSYKQSEQSRIDAVVEKKNSLEKRKDFLLNLNGEINQLNSAIDPFNIVNAEKKFKTRNATSSDESIVTASAASDAQLGVFSVKTIRLANYDTLTSDRINIENNFSERIKGNKSGDFTFFLKQGENEAQEINLSLTGEENGLEALQKIAEAINTIDDLDIAASVIQDTDSTARLSLMSQESGSANAINFSETGKGIFDAIGFDKSVSKNGQNRTIASNAEAGYKTENASELNSKIEINGIEVTRSSNEIEDVISGITLNLKQAQEEDARPVTIETSIDVKGVEDTIKPLLSKFNSTLSYLNKNKDLTRGDAAVNNLFLNLRSAVSDAVTSQTNNDAPKYLTEIGIDINDDGTLTISDSEKLENLLEEDPLSVANLFTSGDSFVAKVSNAIGQLGGSGGIIKERSLSLSDQIDRAEKRREEIEGRINSEAETLRKEYESMLQVYLEAQNQYSLLSAMPTAASSSSSSYGNYLEAYYS